MNVHRKFRFGGFYSPLHPLPPTPCIEQNSARNMRPEWKNRVALFANLKDPLSTLPLTQKNVRSDINCEWSLSFDQLIIRGWLKRHRLMGQKRSVVWHYCACVSRVSCVGAWHVERVCFVGIKWCDARNLVVEGHITLSNCGVSPRLTRGCVDLTADCCTSMNGVVLY